MRIVHVTDVYAPRIGGVESQVRSLAKLQAARGHDVHVVTATQGRTDMDQPLGKGAWENDEGVVVHRLAYPAIAGLPFHPRGVRELPRMLKALAPDVIHAHAGVLSPFAFVAMKAAQQTGTPTVTTWHSMHTGWRWAMKMLSWINKWDSTPVAWTAVGNPGARQVRKMLTTRRSPSTRVDLLPNGVDLDHWLPANYPTESVKLDVRLWTAQEAVSPEVVHTPRPLRVVATQRLEPRKRTIPLLRAAEEARNALLPEQDLQLLIIGVGSEDGEVKRWITRHEAEGWAIQAGKLDRDHLREIYRRADVFVAPAVLEAFGIAALEARAAGLPVIGFSRSGVADFVKNDVGGLMVRNDKELVAALVKMAEEPELVQRLGDYNVRVIPEFDWSNVLQATHEQYLRAVVIQKEAQNLGKTYQFPEPKKLDDQKGTNGPKIST